MSTASALELTANWPVDHVSAAVIDTDGDVQTVGDPRRSFRLASISKPITAWATLVAVEEGIISLDDPLGQPGCTVRHLLAHAGGYAFDGTEPISRPGTRRSYSNTGIEMVADAVASASGMPFADYLGDAVLRPLGMSATELRGSPAHGIWSTLDDVVAFAQDVMASRLLSPATVATATAPVFPALAGVILVSDGSTRVRGVWVSRSVARSNRTGPEHAIHPPRLVTSVVPVPSCGWIRG